MKPKKPTTKTDQEKADQLVARLVWIVIISTLGLAAATKNITTFLTTAAVFSVAGPILAYLLSPVDKKVLIHVARAWRFALIFGVVVGLVVGAVYAQGLFSKVIKIGVDLPVDGTNKDNAGAIQRGIALAVKEEGMIQGYKLDIDFQNHYDAESQYNAEKSKDNLEKMIADPRVAGIIGPYHSTVALTGIPIINGSNASKSKVAMISPSATADCLTRPFTVYENMDDYTRDYKRLCDNLNNDGAFFRTAAYNSKEGAVLANCLSYPAEGSHDLCPGEDMHLYRNVAVIYDDSNMLYNVDLAAAFAQQWKAKPGNKSAVRLARLFVNGDKESFRTELTSKLKEATAELGVVPDLVFFAGEVESTKVLHELMKSSTDYDLPDMSKTALASGASIMADDFKDYLDKNAASVSTAPIYDVAPLKNLDTPDNDTQKGSRDFIRKYNNEYHVNPTPYSGAGYAAAKILIKAIRSAGDVPDFNDSARVKEFRANVIERIKHPARAEIGIIGEYRFDSGDLVKSAVSVFKWNPSNPGNFNGWDYK